LSRIQKSKVSTKGFSQVLLSIPVLVASATGATPPKKVDVHFSSTHAFRLSPPFLSFDWGSRQLQIMHVSRMAPSPAWLEGPRTVELPLFSGLCASKRMSETPPFLPPSAYCFKTVGPPFSFFPPPSPWPSVPATTSALFPSAPSPLYPLLRVDLRRRPCHVFLQSRGHPPVLMATSLLPLLLSERDRPAEGDLSSYLVDLRVNPTGNQSFVFLRKDARPSPPSAWEGPSNLPKFFP